MARKKISREECLAFLDRFHNSKLSIARFCENENISIPTFYKRKRRVNAGLENRKLPKTPIRFVPLRTPGTPITLQSNFCLEMKSGSVLKIPMQFDPQSATSLLRILREQNF